MISIAFTAAGSWEPSQYVTTDVDAIGVMNQVEYWNLPEPPESTVCGNTGTPGGYVPGTDTWCWASYSNALNQRAAASADILYWVTAGATQVTFLSSANPIIWVVEVAGFGGLPVVDAFAMTGAPNTSPAHVISPALAGSGSEDLLITVAATDNTSYTSANIPSPWMIDPTVIDGNAPSYILNGSGTEAQFDYGVGNDSFTSVAVAFKGGANFCGGMSSQAVGNPLVKGRAHSVRG